MIFKVIVDNVIATATNLQVLTAGMVNGRAVEFEFSQEWDSLNKTAVFTNGEETRIVPEYKWGEDGIAYIPPEVLTVPYSYVKCGVYGIDEDGKVVIPTLWADLGRVFPSASPDEYEESVPPTPNTWDDLQNQIGVLSRLNTKEKANLVKAINEVLASGANTKEEIYKYLEENMPEDGITPHIGENGNWWFGEEDTGVQAEGKTPIKGVDYLTPKEQQQFIDEVEVVVDKARVQADNAKDSADEAKYSEAMSKSHSQVAEHYAKEAEIMRTGNSRAFVIETKERLERYLLNQEYVSFARVENGVEKLYKPVDLDTGDVIYVKELNVPDFWWVKTTDPKDSYEGEFFDGVRRKYQGPLSEETAITARVNSIYSEIQNQNRSFRVDETVVNTEGENLKPDYSWYREDSGTKSRPYMIGSPAQLLALSNLSNGTYDPADINETEATVKYFDGCYFVQTANIDMGGISFMPIATEEIYERNGKNYSRLQYDGNCHFISNFTQSGWRVGGVFGYIGGYTRETPNSDMICGIRNLTVKNATINATHNAGAVVGVVSEATEVFNCHSISCTITSDGSGGVIGYINDRERDSGFTFPNKTRVAYCYSVSSVQSSGIYAGGIIGYIDGGADFTCEYCYSASDIYVGRRTDNCFIGGIIGYQDRREDRPTTVVIRNCCFYMGAMTIDTEGVATLGGIYGYLRGSYGSILEMIECFDYGVRHYTAKDRNIAALVGRLEYTNYSVRCYRSHASNHPDGTRHYYKGVDYFIFGVSTSSGIFDSCSYESGPNSYFVDTFLHMQVQLYPLESSAGELKEELDNLRKIQQDENFAIHTEIVNLGVRATDSERLLETLILKGSESGDIVAISDGSTFSPQIKASVSGIVDPKDLTLASLSDWYKSLKCYLSSVSEIVTYIEKSSNWEEDKLYLYRNPEDAMETYDVYIQNHGDGDYRIHENDYNKWGIREASLQSWLDGEFYPGSCNFFSSDVPDITKEGLFLILGGSSEGSLSTTKVYVQGKNLCEIGTVTVTNKAEMVTLKHPIKGGITYNISAYITSTDTDNDFCTVGFYDADGNLIGSNQAFYRNDSTKIVQITPNKDIAKIYFYASGSWDKAEGDVATFANISITPKGVDNTYEPFIYPRIYNVSPDGTVEDFMSFLSETKTTVIWANTLGARVNVSYNRDVNKAFEQMTQAIISLGGNI